MKVIFCMNATHWWGGGGGDRNKWSHMFFFPDYPIVEIELPIAHSLSEANCYTKYHKFVK